MFVSIFQQKMGTASAEERTFFNQQQIPWGYIERGSKVAQGLESDRLDLGAGVVRDGAGTVLSLPSVERTLREVSASRIQGGYPSPLGDQKFRDCIRSFYLSDPANSLVDRSFAVQTIGAAQALRLAADCLSRLGLCPVVAVSEQTWGDHRRIIERAGLPVRSYPYLSAGGEAIAFHAMCDALRELPPGAAVLLQVSCHNPTGHDLSEEQWHMVFRLCRERGLLPILDAAYTGFGTGIAGDLRPIQICIETGLDLLLVGSCCKTFSLYDSRIGALVAVTSDSESAKRLESQIRTEVQANHSSPPPLYAEVIAQILSDSVARSSWGDELEQARRMVEDRRECLVAALARHSAPTSLLGIARQSGIFAWTGFTREQCAELRTRHAINLPSNGRVCVAAIPDREIERVAEALCRVAYQG
jgi:aromatic-amino-acid transaminase